MELKDIKTPLLLVDYNGNRIYCHTVDYGSDGQIRLLVKAVSTYGEEWLCILEGHSSNILQITAVTQNL